ncbi:hypothetical protein F4779DRAFT_588075 [Xylariaceae sp. FL0662B]|nr:hypothetical protein F4779DRAFT_588075 [Xylariaceae sp. FL0662B]
MDRTSIINKPPGHTKVLVAHRTLSLTHLIRHTSRINKARDIAKVLLLRQTLSIKHPISRKSRINQRPKNIKILPVRQALHITHLIRYTSRINEQLEDAKVPLVHQILSIKLLMGRTSRINKQPEQTKIPLVLQAPSMTHPQRSKVGSENREGVGEEKRPQLLLLQHRPIHRETSRAKAKRKSWSRPLMRPHLATSGAIWLKRSCQKWRRRPTKNRYVSRYGRRDSE